MDGSVRKRRCQGIVDKAVLVDEREAGEGRARHDDLEVVAAARPILDGELRGVGKGRAEKGFELDRHTAKLAALASRS